MPALYTFAHKLLIFIAKSSVDTYTLCLHQCLHYTIITTQKSGHAPRAFLSRAAGKAIGAKENPPARDRFYGLPTPVCRAPRHTALASQPNITPHCRAHLLVRFCDCSADNSADKVRMCLHYFYHWISTSYTQKCRMQTKTQILADACAREETPCAHNAKAYAQVCFQRHKNASYERKCVTSPKINRCSTYLIKRTTKPCPPTTDYIK